MKHTYKTPKTQLLRISLIILPAVLIVTIFDQHPYLTEIFSRGQVFGRDAHNLWIAGRILLEEGSARHIYDNAAFTAFQTNIAGSGIGWNSYFYPPPAFLTAAFIGLMPYPIALPIYTLLGLTAFLVAIGAPHFKRPALLLLLIAPMTSFNMIMGQNGLISAALLIGGLRLLTCRPILAGVLFGLLAFKPIIGLLIPPLLLIRKDWVAFFSATATVVITALLPALLWGTEVWTLFFTDAMAIQQTVLHHAVGIGMLMIPSAFNSGRLLGLDTTSAYAIHIFFAAGTLIIFLRHFLNSTSKQNKPLSTQDILLFTLATAMISPYMHNYDLSMVEGAILLYCFSMREEPVTPAHAFLIMACWCTGLLSLFANMAALPIAPVIMMMALCIVARAPQGTDRHRLSTQRPSALTHTPPHHCPGPDAARSPDRHA